MRTYEVCGEVSAMLYTNENSNCSSAVSSTRHTFTYTAASPLRRTPVSLHASARFTG